MEKHGSPASQCSRHPCREKCLCTGDFSSTGYPVVRRGYRPKPPIGSQVQLIGQMFNLTSIDPCGSTLSAMDAYFRGVRLELKVNEIVECGVQASPVDPVFGFLTFRCVMPQWMTHHMMVDMTFTVCNFHASGGDELVTLTSKSGELLPILHPRSHDTCIAEAFSGLGGWTLGAKMNGGQVSLMVERDPKVAQFCAYNHSATVMSADEALSCIRDNCLPSRVVLNADMKDMQVYIIAGLLGVNTWLASPPCPPWSKAGWQRGLDEEEGAIFAIFMLWVGISRARCVNLENVPGLPDHPHYGVLRQAIDLAGFDVVMSSRDKAMPMLPIMRVRWLATCIRKDVHYTAAKLSMAQSVSVPRSVPGIGETNSIGSFGCVQSDLQPWEVPQCVPKAAVLDILSKPEFLPLNMRKGDYMKLSGTDILKMRTKDVRQPLPNVMAAQGSQDLLPHDLLQKKGLYSFLVVVNGCLRFATPFEICAAMGFPAETCLPDSFQDAWHMVGNALAVPHAALQCFRSWVLIGNMSGFSGEMKSVQEMCQNVLTQKCVLANYEVVHADGIMRLQLKRQSVLSMPTTIIDSSDDETNENGDNHGNKRACISPTWECIHEEPTLIPELNKRDCPNLASHTVGTRTVQTGMPFFYEIGVDLQESDDSQIVVKILHSQGSWFTAFVIPKMWSIKNILQSVLPHAKQEHFDHIEVNGAKVWFGSTPIGESRLNILFKPFCFARTVVTCYMELGLVVEVDVTWKFADLCAYVATEAAILPSSLQIVVDERIMMSSEFVMSTSELHFKAVPVTSHTEIPRQISDQQVMPIHDPIHTDEGTIFHPGIVRFTIRNPKWGTIRSCAAAKNEQVGDLIDRLLPNFLDGKAPVLTCDEVQIDPSMTIGQLPEGKFEISFPTAKPWPVAELVVSKFTIKSAFHVGDAPCVKAWIKGPFDARAMQLSLPVNDTLLHVAAKFLAVAKSDLTLIVMQNGKGIDPRLLMRQITSDATIEFRACALPGGAKGSPKVNETNAKKLQAILSQRGVPDESLAARAALLVGTIDAAELTAILSKDDRAVWDELKIKANKAKIRMITNIELKEHQKLQRKKAAEGTLQQKPTKTSKKGKPAGADDEPLKKVFIDPKHFQCESGKINIIDLAQWGPDQCGIAIATTAEANKMMPIDKISPEPLALVVLTKDVFAGQVPIALPATEISGRPVLTSAVVLNFGDIEVHCKPNLPKVDLQEIPTATLEVFIMKNLVNQWQDVQNPLNYLGLQLPEIRKGQVISSWNFRSYDENRQRCKHDQAKYVHGFVKIPEEVLQPTLVRSGQAGVFLQVKAENKKPDPRFGVVALHGQPLEEVVKLAKTLKNVLGVVQLGQNGVFALRARREHIQEIRRNALPQGISLQEGEIPAGASWWILRNLNASTTCDAVTTALLELGWKASAIRPSGKNSWVVCSADEPPATHLCIGSDYVAVSPARSQTAAKPAEVPVSVAKIGANFCPSMCPEESVGDVTTPTTVTSRIDNIKADLKADLEERLTNMIQDRMRECDMRVDYLAASVEQVQSEVKEVQSAVEDLKVDTKAEFSSIRGDITEGNNTIMSQMQNLFSKMQSELQTTLNANKDVSVEADAKRPRH